TSRKNSPLPRRPERTPSPPRRFRSTSRTAPPSTRAGRKNRQRSRTNRRRPTRSTSRRPTPTPRRNRPHRKLRSPCRSRRRARPQHRSRPATRSDQKAELHAFLPPAGPYSQGGGGSVVVCGPVGGWGGGVGGVSPRPVGHPSGYRRTCGGRQAEPLRGRFASLAPPAEPAVRRSCPTDRGEPPPTGRSCGGG